MCVSEAGGLGFHQSEAGSRRGPGGATPFGRHRGCALPHPRVPGLGWPQLRAGSAAACRCELPGLLLHGPHRLGPRCLHMVPGAAQEVGGEGQLARLWGWVCVLSLWPLVFLVPRCLCVCLADSVSTSLGGGSGLVRMVLWFSAFPSLSLARSSVSVSLATMGSPCGSSAESGIPLSIARGFLGCQAVGRRGQWAERQEMLCQTCEVLSRWRDR